MIILANAAIPVFVIALPWMVWLFPAVIVLEAVLAKKDLSIGWPSSLLPLVVANLVSTLIGLAVLYGLTFGLAPLAEHSSATKKAVFLLWLYPGATSIVYSFLVMSAFFIACMLLSVFIECKIVARAWTTVETSALRRYEWKSHIISYSAMIALWLVLMIDWVREGVK